MNKGLEALETLITHRKFGGIEAQWEREECRKTIEKELKALEIVKKYEMVRYIEWFGLTQEECDLLKEVLS